MWGKSAKMSCGIYLIFTILIASSCLLSVSAINHGINGGAACDTEDGDSPLQGICTTKAQCVADGGTPSGRCGLGWCCSGGASPFKPIRMKRVSISRPSSLSSPITYYISARSNLVCQLRIDFVKLVLAEPSLQDNHPQCWADSLQVDDIRLCGINHGQHIYVPFNATAGATTKELRFTLANRAMNPTLVNPDWLIRVTQLECPNNPSRVMIRQGRNIPIGSTTDEVIVDAESSLREPRTGHGAVEEPIPAGDAYWVAPTGCLQYFPMPSGTIESFNFNSGNGVYMGNMKYSICFRRTTNDEKLILTANTFAMGSAEVTPTNEGYDELCYTNIMSPGRSEDYLFIPEGVRQSFPNVRATRFCGRSIDGGVTVISNMPGPLAIHFNSDTYYHSNRTESGFQLTYQIS